MGTEESKKIWEENAQFWDNAMGDESNEFHREVVRPKVESGDRFRYISYYEIYEADTSSYYYTGSVAYSFDGEAAITNAIDYVTTEDLPLLYILTGHGEAELSDAFSSALEKQNTETAELTLLTVDEIPEDADGILIYAPKRDISEEEADILNAYISAGGRLLVISGPQEEELTQLHSLLEVYGISFAEGIVVEGDRGYYAFNAPYVLLPELGTGEITEELSANNRYVIVPVAQGMNVDTAYGSADVTSLLDTSDASYSKASGYAMDTYEKEAGDAAGPFSVAVLVKDGEADGAVIWISSDNVMDDLYNSYSSGANTDFVMNAVSLLVGRGDSISIRSKSLDYNYLTISTAQSAFIKVCLIGIIPLLVLLYGLEDVIRRRRQA